MHNNFRGENIVICDDHSSIKVVNFDECTFVGTTSGQFKLNKCATSGKIERNEDIHNLCMLS